MTIEQDAKRYRCLRELHWSDNTLAVVVKPKDNVMLGMICLSQGLLDAKLDEFIAESEKDTQLKDAERYRFLFSGGEKVYTNFQKVYTHWDGSNGKAGFDAALEAVKRGEV